MRRLRRGLGNVLLAILAVSFVGSGLLRFGPSTVLAADSSIQPLDDDQGVPQSASDEGVSANALLGLLRQVQEREAALQERELELDEDRQLLELSRQEIQRNLDALVEAEQRLKETLALADGAAENDLARLTKVYEAMKPKAAAQVFSEMDPNFAAGFLGRMQPAASAAILAGMEPTIAYQISVILAGRNSEVPTE